MADRTDPAGQTTGGTGVVTLPPGPTTHTPAGSPSDVGTIPLTDHEAAIETERRRRAGQERAHQKEISTVRAELEELKSLIQSQPSQPRLSSASVTSLLSRLDSGDPQAVREAVREGLVAVSAWTDRLSRQEEEQLTLRRTSAAVEDAVSDLLDAHPDVPRSALDLSSPEAVRISAAAYLKDQELAAIRAELAELKRGHTTTEEAVTRTRSELGANRVLTSTGTQPVTASEVEEEVAQLEQEVAREKRLRHGDRVMALNRRLEQARAELAASRQ